MIPPTNFETFDKEHTVREPEFALQNMPQDLAKVLEHVVDHTDFKILTPENIFLQQIIRLLNDINGRLTNIEKAFDIDKTEQPTQEEPKKRSNQLVFVTDQGPQVHNNPNS